MRTFKNRVLVAAVAFVIAAAISSMRGRDPRPESTNAPRLPSANVQTARSPTPAFQCGTKHYCREMTTCEEARFFLTQCGVTTIDGDHDGVPCEQALCR